MPLLIQKEGRINIEEKFVFSLYHKQCTLKNLVRNFFIVNNMIQNFHPKLIVVSSQPKTFIFIFLPGQYLSVLSFPELTHPVSLIPSYRSLVVSSLAVCFSIPRFIHISRVPCRDSKCGFVYFQQTWISLDNNLEIPVIIVVSSPAESCRFFEP